MNNFSEGQKVICISEDFPIIKKYSPNGIQANKTSKPGEILVIDEILGDFLRFDIYDTNNSFNWWHHTRFAPIDESEIEEQVNELIQELILK